MLFSFVTPEKRLVTDVEVEEVIVPAERGQLTILPGHSPLMTVLHAGVLEYRLKGQSERQHASVSWGYCEVHPSGVVVLAETAEAMEEVDKERAERALKKAQEQLVEIPAEPNQILKFQRKVKRAHARIELSKKKN